MAGIIQMLVIVDENRRIITVQQDSTVDDLYKDVAKVCGFGVPLEGISLICGTEQLEPKANKTLKDYNIVHMSTVTPLVHLHSAICPAETIEKKSKGLVPLPGYITVTTSPAEPDMVSFDDSEDRKRAKMPCGHVIGPDSMTSYCQSLLSSGRYRFMCPAVDKSGNACCNREWEYFMVRHVACLSPDEMHKFEKKLADNYLNRADGMQQCPGCQTWCFKAPEVGNCVRCPSCTKTNGEAFDFCWICLNKWQGGLRGPCGNSGCEGKDKRLHFLESCPTKQIYNCRNCPSVRGCPKCGMLIEHKDACAHMDCTSCHHGFCFICLKGKGSDGRWQCCYTGNCDLAPRQTSLTGS